VETEPAGSGVELELHLAKPRHGLRRQEPPDDPVREGAGRNVMLFVDQQKRGGIAGGNVKPPVGFPGIHPAWGSFYAAIRIGDGEVLTDRHALGMKTKGSKVKGSWSEPIPRAKPATNFITFFHSTTRSLATDRRNV
jgi:hypothetical protein